MKLIKTNEVTYVTEDYDEFKKLLGNREVTKERVLSIVDSIKAIGQMKTPILVNEKFEIIDGQGRLEAFKILHLPVYYQIQNGAGINECIRMNIKIKNWTVNDFVKSYADLGNNDYSLLIKIKNKYPYLSFINIACSFNNTSNLTGITKNLKNGEFKVQDINKGIECIKFIDCMQEKINKTDSRKEVIYSVLQGLFYNDLIDLDRMIEQFNKYDGHTYIGDVNSCLDYLQEVYNYRRRTNIYFKDNYLKIMDAKKSHYGERA